MTRPPRHFVHRGSVLASAYLLPDTQASRATVLKRWRPGHALHRCGARLLWLLPEPERVACDAAPGLPLVAAFGRLCGAPFREGELDGLLAGVTVVEGGTLTVLSPGDAVDPSHWLEVSRFTLAARVLPLGEPPPPPEPGFVPRPPSDARTALKMPALSSDAAAVQREQRQPARAAAPASPEPAPAAVGPAARGLVTGLRAVARWLRRIFPARPSQAEAPGSALAPSLLDRLDAALTRLLDASRLSALFSQRQADYFARLMQMFEQGDLDQALRHAIPLADPRTPAAPARPSLALPTPRDSLDIPLRPPGAANGAIVLGDFYEQLRRRYRAAAEKLEAEGRTKEAAFVLAELLHADEEAIALLERHQQYELAAELAEARQLPPGMQVRQWFLAKNVARAVAVARRHGVFADAIGRLVRSQHDAEAKQLRLLWADSFAASGDFYNAVHTASPLDDAKPLIRRWIELGIAQGGQAAARLEVQRLVYDKEADARRLLGRLDSDDPDGLAERAVICSELKLRGEAVGSARTLARAAVRSLMRDGVGPPPAELVTLAADGALKADLPQHRLVDPKLSTRSPPVRHDLEAWDKGALPVLDAALLPDGRTLLALGEAGARLVTRDGRTVKHFDVPCESLVPWDTGGHALCLSWRGEVLVTSRVDLGTGRVEQEPQLRLFSWADGTDGSMWFVHDGQALCGLDLHDAKLRALWRTPMPAPNGRPVRSAIALSVVPSPAPGELEWWRYELPSLTLRNRQRLQLPQVNERVAVLADGHTCVTQGGVAWHQQFATPGQRRQLTGLAGGVIVDVDGAGEWFSLVTRSEAGLRWLLVDLLAVTVRHVVQLPRTAGFRVRMRKDVAVWSDHDGRVLAVDLDTGRLSRSLRVR